MAKGNRGGKNGATTGYYITVDTYKSAKIIQPTSKGSMSLPRMSHSPNAIYILKNKNGKYKSMGIYNEHREIVKEFDIGHGHKRRNKRGEVVQHLKRGVFHTHIAKGGRENDTRYLTKKEIKKYGDYLHFIGGMLSE